MLRDRTFLNKKIATAFHQERFYPSGNYTWRVPEGCESVDVFLVGGGGGCANVSAELEVTPSAINRIYLDIKMEIRYRLRLVKIYLLS